MQKNLIVIGAAGGLGLEVTRALLARGERVIATVIDDAEASRVRTAAPGCTDVVKLDLSDAERTGQALTEIIQSSGRPLHGIAICAAVCPMYPVETTPIDVIRETMEVNFVAPVTIYQAAMPALRETKGRIVLVTSIAGKRAGTFVGVYSASKFALEGAADVMRREAAKWGVHVVVVEPGGIQSAMGRKATDTLPGRTKALAEPEKSLYGDLYQGFENSCRGGYDTSSSPDHIASYVLEGLYAVDPLPRYVAGEDAKALMDLTAAMSDREIDAIFGAGMTPAD